MSLLALSVGALVLDPSPINTTEAKLNKLLEYQIFGADYVRAGSELGLTNSKGYFGSNLEVTATNGAWQIYPTTIIGGDGGGSAKFMDNCKFYNDVLIEGSLTLQNQNYFYPTDSLSGSILAYDSLLSGSPTVASGVTVYSTSSAWPSSLRALQEDLSIPTLDVGSCVSDDPNYPNGSNIEVNPDNNLGSAYDVKIIDASSINDSVVDYCFGNITGNPNGYKVLFKKKSNQILRIFVLGTYSFNQKHSFGITTGGDTLISPNDYDGSMLVYLNGGVSATNADSVQWMGSFIIPDTLALWQKTALTGQIAAQALTIQNYLNGEKFKYVPFNSAVVDPSVSVDGDSALSEANTSARTVTISLDKAATIEVSLHYHLVWGSSNPASSADFTSADTAGVLSISPGDSTASFTLQVFDDTLVEGTETFFLILDSIDGALFPDEADSLKISMSILDNDNSAKNTAPMTKDTSVTLIEDSIYVFSASDFPFSDTGTAPISLSAVSIVTIPDKGTLWLDLDQNGAIAADGSENIAAGDSLLISDLVYLNFLPDTNAFGIPYTSFTFSVSDGKLSSGNATMTINMTAVNDTPSISALTDTSIDEDGTTGARTFTISDVETAVGSLTVTASSSNTALVAASGIVLGGSGASRTIMVTPLANQNGTTVITVVVSDGALADTTIWTLTVTSVNDAPVAVADSVSGLEDSLLSVPLSSLLSNDSDVDDDVLTVSSVYDVTHGSVSLNGDSVVFTPAADYYGTATFSYVVSDGNGGLDTALVTIEVIHVNTAPELTLSDQSTLEDAIYRDTAVAVDPDDDEVLTYTLVDPPSGLKIDSATGELTWTPENDDVGSYTVTVVVTDASGASDTASYVLTVINVNDA
ncbi:MAG TPA: tandem-95 repeat protein, partial [Fibrobacteraceae bacterium]|nr:tandem-95 repeat protein [Fibrobacteraceae bacterium]